MTLVTMDDGVRLWTETTGRAGEASPAVLVHGGPGLWDYLSPLARLIDDGTVVHRYDQRGCGRSEAGGEQRVDRAVFDLENLRRYWGYERWIVIGHSFGAWLALVYAWRHPARVRCLVYLSGTGIGDWKTAFRREIDRRMTPRQRDRLAELKSQSHRSALEEREFRALAWFTDHSDRERAWGWATEDAAVPYPINWAANSELMEGVNSWTEDAVRTECERMTAPVTLIHGSADPRPHATVATLAEALPAGRLHLLAGAGHHPWRESPDELRALLQEAVRRA